MLYCFEPKIFLTLIGTESARVTWIEMKQRENDTRRALFEAKRGPTTEFEGFYSEMAARCRKPRPAPFANRYCREQLRALRRFRGRSSPLPPDLRCGGRWYRPAGPRIAPRGNLARKNASEVCFGSWVLDPSAALARMTFVKNRPAYRSRWNG